MTESLRIFGILLHKCWLVSKRHWIKTLFGQTLLPIGLVICAWIIFENNTVFPKRIEIDSHHKMLSSEKLINDTINQYSVPIVYASNNTFTDELMKKVNECFKNKTIIRKFHTEADIVDFYRKKSHEFNGIAVIFDQSTNSSTKHLQYKLQIKSLPDNQLYYPSPPPSHSYFRSSPFVQIQICLSESFVKIKSKKDVPQTFIQEVPYPAHTDGFITDPTASLICYFLLVVALMIPAFIETLKAMNEKFVGINVLMSMNGISSTLNLLSWVISGLLLSTAISVITTFLMFISFDESHSPFVTSGNPFIIFLVFIFHIIHTITFDLHISAYLSKALSVMPVIFLVNFLAIVLHIYVLEESNFFVAPYVGMIFPIILLYQAINQIYSYETIAGDLHWNNLFGHKNLMIKMEKSIGMVIVSSAVGLIFHFLLANYVHAINPGKYGIRHHPLFFLMSINKQQNDESVQTLIYNNVEDRYFEPTSARHYTPGIQIRNLKKAYDISIFNKEKVHALRGISVDFYKGQITSLLGHNGAGKSTLMSILTRMTCPSEGLIFINSKDLKKNACEILKDMGLCAQDDMYFPSLTVTEQLEFFIMVKRNDKSKSPIKENIEDLIQNFKLSNVKDALPNDLSGDQKRKLCLAMALVGDPSILILDEPTYGLDPHSKRIVWDVLLKMKDQKTILISTHDMDEADILGDRIAILHDGQLKSYGTSLFLKKTIGGQNSVEVTLYIERWSDLNKILNELHHTAVVVNETSGEIVLSVPTLTLPCWLRTLEDKKKDLDISGYSLANISLERVFHKLTEENACLRKFHETITSDEQKLKGLALHLQSARALFFKKMSYTLKNLTTILIQILMVIIALLTVAIVRMTREHEDQPTMPMNLSMYDNPQTRYTSFNTTIGDRYQSVSRIQGGYPVAITNTNIDNELIRWAKQDLAHYVKYMIAAAEFNETTNGIVANAFYSERATHSLPMSINLLWNTIIQNILGPDYAISLSSQELSNVKLDPCGMRCLNLSTLTTAVFVILFSFVIAAFVTHPSQERSRGIKQLQKVTGTSGFTYWGTMFLFDLMVCAIFMLLLIVGSVCMDYSIGLHFYQTDEIMVTVLLLMLFAVNTLPMIYTFSFIKTKTKNLVKLLTFMPIGLVSFGIVTVFYQETYPEFKLTDYANEFSAIDVILKIFLLLPYVSLTHAHVGLYWIGLHNARCKKLPNIFYDSQCKDEHAGDYCCELKCYNGKCLKSIPYFKEGNIGLRKSVTYLCATPILYFSILAVLESRLLPKMMAKLQIQQTAGSIGDEQVEREKSTVFQQIQTLSDKRKSANSSRINIRNQKPPMEHLSNSSDNRVFLVYEMQKSYKKVKAVTDISFGINRCECFGLFGVNGSGKSTLFRMMTGEETPDHGVMYMRDMHFKNHGKYVGYCAQYDATLKCLNSYDHLRLFARLRGISEDQVESEVQDWIGRLNLNDCALQPSGTLSSGNNQRLNMAMALIGNPSLILMDEPTSRMDPGARRSFWNTIKSCQMAGQTFLLASHNMDECAAVCNRMAIMADGKLMCIGTPKELKHRFGAGYDVQIRMNPRESSNQLDQVKKDMRLLLDCTLINENLGHLMYYVIGAGTTWKKMYKVMNTIKSKNDCIDDFLIVVRLST